MRMEKSKSEDTKKARRILDSVRMSELLRFSAEVLAKHIISLEKELVRDEIEINSLLKKNQELEERIEKLEKPPDPMAMYNDYPKEKDFIGKLLFILSKNKGALTFEEIYEVFSALEPDLEDRWTNPGKSISKIISRACKFGVVSRAKIYGNYGNYNYYLTQNNLRPG